MRSALLWLGLLGCRDFHEPLPFEDCQPYPLTCRDCTFADDRSEAQGRLRVWACQTPEALRYDAVLRRAFVEPADDTRFYDPATGLRRAALRSHDVPTDVCGTSMDQSWYGEILDCAPLCEHEPNDPDADPTLPLCSELELL
ncbi:MAG TPA: hypothetical protein ENK18_04830 [Deltaproteobacteria bacterium]|nr:hypothetical protein [Deltaproteobacteria bacterium]